MKLTVFKHTFFENLSLNTLLNWINMLIFVIQSFDVLDFCYTYLKRYITASVKDYHWLNQLYTLWQKVSHVTLKLLRTREGLPWAPGFWVGAWWHSDSLTWDVFVSYFLVNALREDLGVDSSVVGFEHRNSFESYFIELIMHLSRSPILLILNDLQASWIRWVGVIASPLSIVGSKFTMKWNEFSNNW